MLTTKPLYYSTVRSVPFSTTLCVPEQAVWRRKRGHVAFTGQEEDKESGLLYYKARYYDPGLGRFLQADDLLFPDSSQGMNRLMYEEGNPITYSDPTGQFLSGNIFDNLVKELTSFTMRSVGQNLAKAVQRATFLNKTRVDALLFKRENYYTKSDMVRGYRSLGDQYIGYIKDPVTVIDSDFVRFSFHVKILT